MNKETPNLKSDGKSDFQILEQGEPTEEDRKKEKEK